MAAKVLLDLPNEVLLLILHKLQPDDIHFRCAQVCRRLKDLVESNFNVVPKIEVNGIQDLTKFTDFCLKQKPNVQSLSLSSCKEGADVLKALEAVPTLTELQLDFVTLRSRSRDEGLISPEGLECLEKSLTRLDKLSLSVPYPSLIWSILMVLPSVTHLSIDIDNAIMIHLAHPVYPRIPCNVKHLVIGRVAENGSYPLLHRMSELFLKHLPKVIT